LARSEFVPQKPARRALERDEEAIEKWVHENWPRINKMRRGSGRT
jgi:hypothetical protein